MIINHFVIFSSSFLSFFLRDVSGWRCVFFSRRLLPSIKSKPTASMFALGNVFHRWDKTRHRPSFSRISFWSTAIYWPSSIVDRQATRHFHSVSLQKKTTTTTSTMTANIYRSSRRLPSAHRGEDFHASFRFQIDSVRAEANQRKEIDRRIFRSRIRVIIRSVRVSFFSRLIFSAPLGGWNLIAR